MNRVHRTLRDERGQILVIVAGGMIALLAIAAVALEGGMLVLNRRDAQNASDLAAVAGARQVALNYVESARAQNAVHAAVEDSLAANGCVTDDACTWTARFSGAGLADLGAVTDSGAAIPSGSLGVHVLITKQVGATIGHVLGRDTWDVSTEATAISAKPSAFPTGILLPIALCGWSNPAGDDCTQATTTPAPGNFIDFQPGQTYDLTNGKDAPGGFGWLSFTGSNSAGALSDAICNPNNPQFSLDSPYDSPDAYGGYIGTNPATGETWFPVDPGKSNASAVRACLDGWIESGATVLIPVYDIVTGTGNNAAYHITGVAAFHLTYRSQPAVDVIKGDFVEYYPYTDIPGGVGTLPPGPEDNTYFLGLVK